MNKRSKLVESIFRNAKLLRVFVGFLDARTLRNLRLVNCEFRSKLDKVPEHCFQEYHRIAFRPDILTLNFASVNSTSACSSCKARESAESAWLRKLAGEEPEPRLHTIGGWPVAIYDDEVTKPSYLHFCHQRGWFICDDPITGPQPCGTVSFTRVSDWTPVKTRYPACIVKCQGCRDHRIKIIRDNPDLFLRNK